MQPTGVDRGLLREVVGDGVPLLLLTAFGLTFAGAFAMFLAATGEFLPHDVRYLRMTAAELCTVADCRVVDFMIHDRAAFGGALFGVGVLYVYLVLFPLRQGQAWAWWLLLVSGSLGFVSFLAYFGYGYLDRWHGVGTLAMLPGYALGMARSRILIRPWQGPAVLVTAGRLPDLRTRAGLGRACLILGAGATAIGGSVIVGVGLTGVFVPEDLAFMGVTVEELRAVSPRLVSLIAHDRVGFGCAVVIIGVTALTCLWCAPVDRASWEALALSGSVALTAAIGTHLHVGYLDPWHLAPVLMAAGSMIIGLALTVPRAAAGGHARARPEA
jgi:hypothetical protein